MIRDTVCLTALLGLALVLPVQAQQKDSAAQPPKKEKPLTWRETRDLVRANDEHLRVARRAREYSDPEELHEALGKFGKNAERIRRAIGENNLEERDADDILKTVDEAASRHTEVLTGLLGTVPEPARPAIQRALQVSQRGGQAAQAALARRGGKPEGVGKPSGTPGPPAGSPGAGGKPGGPPGGRPGGPPK